MNMPGFYYYHLHLAAVYGQLGEYELAAQPVRDLLELKPDIEFTVRDDLSMWTGPELVEHEIEGLRKAGLKIAAAPNQEEPKTQILQAATTAEKLPTSNTKSEDGFWVAVLPFKYRGANADLEALAEGLSEEIVTGLSRFSYLRVIARGSTLRYADDAGDVRAIGKEIGARYVLEGSLRQAGAMLRVAVQLVDASTGAHLWAETYNRTFSSEAVFELQDDLVPLIVSTVADQYGALVHSMSESLRGRSVGQYSAYEAVLRTFGYLERIMPEEHSEVRAILEAAVSDAPGQSDCQSMLSLIYWHEYANGYNVKPDSLGRALAAARQATAIAPTNHLAHYALACVFFFQKDFASFRPAAERALALNRMDASTTAFLGILIAYSGDWEYGLSVVERAMRLNPHHAGWYHFPAFHYAYHRRDYRGALEIALKVNMPGYFFAHTALAAVYGQLGEQERARAELRELHALMPNFSALAGEEYGKWFDPELTEHLLDGLSKAGLELESTQKQEEQKTQSLKVSTTAEEQPTKVETQNSIAVLPFTNMSADEDNEYFCDGLAEELLNALSKIEDLKVAARTSAFSFKGKNANVSEIGEKLSVKNVLEGSVRKSGNKLRISVQLVNAAGGYQLWSERYDRELKDIFDVQDEIALAVVDALKLKLFGEEKSAVLKRYTNNAEAYQLYLKGRFYFGKFTAEGVKKSIEYYEQALAKEPDYAPAFAALSVSYIFFWYLGFGETAKYISEAQTAVEKALILDQSLAEAYFALALVKFNYERDWTEAEKAFRRAIELNPNYSESYEHYGMFLAVMERSDEAVAIGKRAVEIAPLSLKTIYIAGWAFWLAGQTDLAKEQGEKLLEMEPNFSGGHIHLGISLWNKGAYQKSHIALETAVKLGGGNDIRMLLGLLHGIVGEREKAKQLLTEFQQLDEQGIFTANQQAFIYAGLGEMDRAFVLLEQAAERREGTLVFLKQFSSLYPKFHNDSRMTDLLHRLGLPTDKTNQTDESLEAQTVMLSEPPAVAGGLTPSSQEPDKKITTANANLQPSATAGGSDLSAKRKSKWWLFGLLGLLALVVGLFGYKYLSPTTKQINSIAVLPFENKSSDADTDYLSDGLAESLIYRLSQIPDLKVSPTSSVFRYKGKATDPQVIAKELGVDSVMTGRITQRGDTLNISVNLVDTRNGKSLWGEQYERKMSELLATQKEIAAEITNKLQLKLSGEGEQKLAKNYTGNTEAYQLYLKGRYQLNKRTEESFRSGIEFFRQAIERDPNYALAYAGLADAYNQMGMWTTLPPSESFPKAKVAAERALQLDDSLAEAHTALAFTKYRYEWDFAGAERECQRAISLNPNYAAARELYGFQMYLVNPRSFDEAIRELKTAQEIDPLSLSTNFNMAAILYFERQYDKALEQLDAIQKLDPNFTLGYGLRGAIYRGKGMYDESVAAWNSVSTLEGAGFSKEELDVLREAYKESGFKAHSRKHAELLQA
jgi:serine/threonine-protein kinase